MKRSKKWRLNLVNIITGTVQAILTALSSEFTIALGTWNSYNDINWQRIAIVAGSALVAYLGRKLIQDEKGGYR